MSDATATSPAPAAAVPLPRLVRFAVDSDSLTSLFPADFVRTYSDLVATTDELHGLRARFPDSVVELIDRGLGDPTGSATIANIEPGSLSPAEGADRIRAWHAEGRTDLVAYCDQAELQAVVDACQGLSYWKWIASWGQMVVAEHRDAQVQFANAAMLGVHADLTVIWNPAYRPAPAAAAAAATLEHVTAAAMSQARQLLATQAAAAPAGEPALAADGLAQLRGIHERMRTQHGSLAVLERDANLLHQVLHEHAGLLAELTHLLP